MNKFFEIEKIGMLKVDRVLFESYIPILFTCTNEENELFLCVCCQANATGKKWLITKTSPQVIINLLKDNITIREAFLKFDDIQITVLADNAGVQINEKNIEDWDPNTSRSLPSSGEYMEAEGDEFQEEIEYYETCIKNTINQMMVNDEFEIEIPMMFEQERYQTLALDEMEVAYDSESRNSISSIVYMVYERNREIDIRSEQNLIFETSIISDEIDYAA